MTTRIKLLLGSLSLAAVGIAAGVFAFSGGNANASVAEDDFNRDLQLASSTLNLNAPRVDPSLLTLEAKPQGAPQAAKTVKKGAGSRAVRSHSPTVRATPEMDVAAVDENSEQV